MSDKDYKARKYEKQNRLAEKERERRKSHQHLYEIVANIKNDGVDEAEEKKILEGIGTTLSSEQSTDALRWLRDTIVNIRNERKGLGNNVKEDSLIDPSEHAKQASIKNPGFKKVVEFLDLSLPDDPNEKWVISKNLDSKALDSDIEYLNFFIRYEIDFNECKSCYNSFDNLLQHLKKQPKCNEKYSDFDMNEMKETKKLARLAAMR